VQLCFPSQDASGEGVSFCLDDVSVTPLPRDARWALLPADGAPQTAAVATAPPPAAVPPPLPLPDAAASAAPASAAGRAPRAAPAARRYVSYWATWPEAGHALPPASDGHNRDVFLRALRKEMAAWLANATAAPPQRTTLLQAVAGEGEGAALSARFALAFAPAADAADVGAPAPGAAGGRDAVAPPRRTLLLKRADFAAAASSAKAAATRAADAAADAADAAADAAAAALRDNKLPPPVGPLLRALGRARFSGVAVSATPPPPDAPLPAALASPEEAPAPAALAIDAPAPAQQLDAPPPPLPLPLPLIGAAAPSAAVANASGDDARASTAAAAPAATQPESAAAPAAPLQQADAAAPVPAAEAAAALLQSPAGTTSASPSASLASPSSSSPHRDGALPPTVLIALLALSAATAVAGVVFLCAGLAWWRSGMRLRARGDALDGDDGFGGKGKMKGGKGGHKGVLLRSRRPGGGKAGASVKARTAAAVVAEEAPPALGVPSTAAPSSSPPDVAAAAAALTRRIQALRAVALPSAHPGDATPAGRAARAGESLSLGDAFAALGRLSASANGHLPTIDAAAQFAEARACYARAAAAHTAAGDAPGAAAAMTRAAALPGAPATVAAVADAAMTPRRRAGGSGARDTRAPPAERTILAPRSSGARTAHEK
jgi:hypothetical protein